MSIADHLILGLTFAPKDGSALKTPSLPVTAVTMNSWEQIRTGLTSGTLDGAFINTPLAMDLFESGLDIALVMFTHRAGSQMIANPKLNKIRDFKGKSILVPHTLSVQHMLLHKFLSTKGLAVVDRSHPDAVTAEPVAPGLMPEMMAGDKDNDIAAFLTADPYGALAVHKGCGKRLLLSQDLWKNHPCCGFVVRQDLIQTHGDMVAGMIQELFRAADQLDRHIRGTQPLPEDAQALAKAFLDQPAAMVADILDTSGVQFTPDLLVPDPDLLDIIRQYMADTMGLLSGSTDLDTFIQPAFAQSALAELNP